MQEFKIEKVWFSKSAWCSETWPVPDLEDWQQKWPVSETAAATMRVDFDFCTCFSITLLIVKSTRIKQTTKPPFDMVCSILCFLYLFCKCIYSNNLCFELYLVYYWLRCLWNRKELALGQLCIFSGQGEIYFATPSKNPLAQNDRGQQCYTCHQLPVMVPSSNISTCLYIFADEVWRPLSWNLPAGLRKQRGADSLRNFQQGIHTTKSYLCLFLGKATVYLEYWIIQLWVKS